MFRLLVALLLVDPAYATPAPEAYATTVRLVDSLYLDQEQVQPARLLQAAGKGAAREVPWLFTDPRDDGVALRHGAGRPLGHVDATTIDELPAQLLALEQLILDGGDTEGIDVRLAVLQGLTDGLDRYSRILAGDTLTSFDTRLKGTKVGIGARFAWVNEALLVTSVTTPGPAAAAGLKVGDQLLRIDDHSTVNMPLSEATRLAQGKVGSHVTLTLRRGANELELAVVRAEVTLPNVRHRDLGDGIGYLHIEHVSQRTVANVRQATQALRDAGSLTKGLIIDLRGNTGGSMKEAARSADRFLDEGLLLRTVGHDGGRVQNLQSEMRASDEGDELDLPVLILTDGRTASGSEILAGALLEHERTALVGSRTYGKGTVQKIYTLDSDTRLKLTVARYLLANERRIESSGIVPDVLVGELQLDGYGARLQHIDGAVPRDELVLAVHERSGWRNEPDSPDVPLELARQALSVTSGLDRAALLQALQQVAGDVRAKQEARLTEALAARHIDWAPDPDTTRSELWPDAEVSLSTHREPGDIVRVVATVTNHEEAPLHRAMVELRCGTLFPYDDVALPVGLLPAGATATVETRVPLRPGTGPRQDKVDALLHAHHRPVLQAGSAIVHSEAHAVPALNLTARLVPHGEERGPHGHPVYRAELTIGHDGDGALTGVEVHFDYPEDPHIELLDRGARRSVIAAGDSDRFDLTFERAPDGPDPVALQLQVDVERYGRLAHWPLQLPIDGSERAYRSPQIMGPQIPTTAEIGPLRVPLTVVDDGRLDHLRVYVDGVKVAWFAGGKGRAEIAPVVTLPSGTHHLTVVARDDQGLVTEHTFSVRGEAPATAEADPAPRPRQRP